jgi:hypothetical protein
VSHITYVWHLADVWHVTPLHVSLAIPSLPAGRSASASSAGGRPFEHPERAEICGRAAGGRAFHLGLGVGVLLLSARNGAREDGERVEG